MRGPWVTSNVESITIEPGETLTVYLGKRRQDSDPPLSQVELRVTNDGIREVFTDQKDARLRLLDFSAWTKDGKQMENPTDD